MNRNEAIFQVMLALIQTGKHVGAPGDVEYIVNKAEEITDAYLKRCNAALWNRPGFYPAEKL